MDSVTIVLWIEVVLILLYYIMSSVLILYFRSSPILHFRNPQLLFAHDLVSAFQATTNLLILFSATHIPCGMERAKVSFVGPLISIINLCRTIQIATRFYAAVEREANFNREELARRSSISRPTSYHNTPGIILNDGDAHEEMHYFAPSHSVPQPSNISIIAKGPLNYYHGEEGASTEEVDGGRKTIYSTMVGSSKRSFEYLKKQVKVSKVKQTSIALGQILSKYSQRLTNWTVFYIAISMGCLITVGFFILEYLPIRNLDDKSPDPSYCPTFSIYAVTINSVCVFFSLTMFLSILFVRDAYGIHLELIAVGLIWIFGLVLSSILRYFDKWKIVLQVWVLFGQLSLHWIAIGLPVLECWICAKKKKNLTYKSRAIQDSRVTKVETSSSVLINPPPPENSRNSIHMDWYSFEHVLKDPELLMELTRFSIREFSVENMLFYRRLRLLRLMTSAIPVSNYSYEHRQAVLREVRSIYHEFFDYNASNELNVSDDVKQAIRRAIEEGNEVTLLEATLYDQAEAEILRLVFNHTFPRFLQTRSNPNFGSINL